MKGTKIVLFLLFIIYFTVKITEGAGRIIQGKFFGTLNKTLPFNKKETKDVVTYWITQPLDHFNPHDTRTWKQRYFKNDTFYQENGPACIFVSGESSADAYWVIGGSMVQHCSKLNGNIFLLEHRFYGESRPLPDASVESLKFLSISQALADLAGFISFIRSNNDLTGGEVILYGGSYAGTLVAYFRKSYQDLSFISVASSAPIAWKYDFKEYLAVVGRVIKKTSTKCYDIVQSGMKEMSEIIDNIKPGTSNNDALLPLKLCSILDTSKIQDIQVLNTAFTGLFSYFVQYNGIANIGIDYACKLINSFPKDMTNFEIVANAINALNSYLENDCIDFSNDGYCKYIRATSWDSSAVSSGARMWTWQVCNEVASFQTTTSTRQPFGHGIPPSLYVSQCQCAFGKKYTESYIRHALIKHMASHGRFGTKRPNVIYTNGQNDPWASLGIIRPGHLLAGYSSKNPIYIIEDGSHCNDIMPDRISDSISVQNARNATFNHISSWLLENEFNIETTTQAEFTTTQEYEE